MLDAVFTHVTSSAASRDSAAKLTTDSYQFWVASSLNFLTSVVRMSTGMKMEKAIYSINKIYQDHDLKIGVKKN